MRYVLMTTVISFMSLFFTMNTPFAYEFHPGTSWIKQSEDSQFMWGWGAIDGQAITLEGIDESACRLTKNQLSSNNLKAMLQIMTQYYQDAANSDIPWKYMAVIASMKLAGRSGASIENRLEALRSYGVWLHENRNKGKEP